MKHTHSNHPFYFAKKAEQIVPRIFQDKTGQIIKLLSQNKNGLTRHEIHRFFYKNIDTAPFIRKESLRMSVEKIIQRSRVKFRPYNLTIVYNKNNKKYHLDSVNNMLHS